MNKYLAHYLLFSHYFNTQISINCRLEESSRNPTLYPARKNKLAFRKLYQLAPQSEFSQHYIIAVLRTSHQ